MANTAFDETDKKALDSYKDMSVGEILSKTRENYGLSMQEVSDRLKIRLAYIEALEKDDVSVLPGRVYAIGFVRSYADFLNLDGEKIVYLFKNQKVGHSKDTDYSMPTPLDDGQIPNKKVMMICGAILLLVIIGMNSFSDNEGTASIIPDAPDALVLEAKGESDDTETEEIAALDLSADREELESNEGSNEELSEEVAIEKTAYEGLRIKATEDSWVSIRDENGNSLVAKLMREGDEYDLPMDETAIMNTGNIGGLEFYINGKELSISGQRGEVRRNMEIGAEALKNLQKE